MKPQEKKNLIVARKVRIADQNDKAGRPVDDGAGRPACPCVQPKPRSNGWLADRKAFAVPVKRSIRRERPASVDGVVNVASNRPELDLHLTGEARVERKTYPSYAAFKAERRHQQRVGVSGINSLASAIAAVMPRQPEHTTRELRLLAESEAIIERLVQEREMLARRKREANTGKQLREFQLGRMAGWAKLNHNQALGRMDGALKRIKMSNKADKTFLAERGFGAMAPGLSEKVVENRKTGESWVKLVPVTSVIFADESKIAETARRVAEAEERFNADQVEASEQWLDLSYEVYVRRLEEYRNAREALALPDVDVMAPADRFRTIVRLDMRTRALITVFNRDGKVPRWVTLAQQTVRDESSENIVVHLAMEVLRDFLAEASPRKWAGDAVASEIDEAVASEIDEEIVDAVVARRARKAAKSGGEAKAAKKPRRAKAKLAGSIVGAVPVATVAPAPKPVLKVDLVSEAAPVVRSRRAL